MRAVSILLVAGAAMAYGASLGAQSPTAPALPKLITTRQNAFAIPFRLEGVTGNQAKAEVQLHVSDNRGINWQIASRVPPSAGKFSFRARATASIGLWCEPSMITASCVPAGRLLRNCGCSSTLRIRNSI